MLLEKYEEVKNIIQTKTNTSASDNTAAWQEKHCTAV